MKKYARVEDGIVMELIATDGDIETMFHPDMIWVDCSNVPGCSEGWIFDGVEFSEAPSVPAKSLDTVKLELSGQVDSEISAIYSKFTRFSDEYRLREDAARVFVASGYSGDAGPWVMGFATPAGKTAVQAADLIIVQADTLRTTLEVLGGLRMRKYEIKNAVDSGSAQSIHDDIIAKANLAVIGL